ncbi:hypothetical protein RF11_03597 [Thelohanellus kitauei]|uniref:Uncharacterized protein n=1 Tax=Thelohanellus kitauei TaxID=669202 RepID=A0A0C2MRM3_THEKT|nr:hypothetical protein RF11_03597 [Thelohanellus kitauei]
MWTIPELMWKCHNLSLMDPKKRFRSLISASVGIGLKCQIGRTLSRDGSAAHQQHTNAGTQALPKIKEEVSKYSEDKRAINILSGACNLLFLARRADYHIRISACGAPEEPTLGNWHLLDREKWV